MNCFEVWEDKSDCGIKERMLLSEQEIFKQLKESNDIDELVIPIPHGGHYSPNQIMIYSALSIWVRILVQTDFSSIVKALQDSTN